jgi:uncharacterized protein involved in exopolysaccharide biosynthesis
LEAEPAGTGGPDLRKWWRIPAVAVLAAVLGFGTSYIFPPSYQAGTRLLVRVNDTTLLSSDGTTPGSGGPAVIDQTGLARSVAQTQSGLLTNGVVATMVVRKLRLDQIEEEKSLIDPLKVAVRNTIAYTYGYVIRGTYVKLSKFDRAVQDVQEGLAATQLEDSYMISLVARGTSREQAALVTDAAADFLVQLGEEQFRADVAARSRQLTGQVEAANAARHESAASLTEFSRVHDLDSRGVSGGGALQESLDVAVSSASADVAAAKATADAAREAMSGTTGRVRQDRQLALLNAESALAAAGARQLDLRTQRAESADLSASQRTEYLDLLLRSDTANAEYLALQAKYQQALLSAATNPVELTRIDRAVALAYPVAPKRYVYLGIALVLGALLGLLLTARAAWRRGETLFPRDVDEGIPPDFPSPRRSTSAGRDGEPVAQHGDAGEGRRVRRGSHEMFESTAPLSDEDGDRSNGRPS